MNKTLRQHLTAYVQEHLHRNGSTWMAWCDQRKEWSYLLGRVADDQGWQVITIDEKTAGAFGSPPKRREVQDLIADRETFILHLKTSPDKLGWHWAHALLAESLHEKSLRQMLGEWGWRPQSLSTSDEDIARLARRHLDEDPTEWGEGLGQVFPERDELLNVLAGGPVYSATAGESGNDALKDKRLILDVTVEAAGLPEIDESSERSLAHWRIDALARLLVTQAYLIAPQQIGRHEFVIAEAKRDFALQLLDDWQDSRRLRRGLPESILEADQMVALGSYFADADVSPTWFLSHAIERALFVNVCHHLAEKNGRVLLAALASLNSLFDTHAHGFWGERTEPQGRFIPWSELARLSLAVQNLLDAAPQHPWENPTEAIHWYVERGWQVEQAGEDIMRQLYRPTNELLSLITPIREAYTHHWENYLLEWSALWSQAGYPLPEYRTQGEWLKDQLKGGRSTAVLVIDALRYDIGMAILQRINQLHGADRATVTPARTMLPSITALGMPAALPLAEKDLRAEVVNNKWQVMQRGSRVNLSSAENRREWLKEHYKLTSDDLLPLDKRGGAPLPTPKNKHARLFLFDSALDTLGHDDELEAVGSLAIQERYIAVIQRLYEMGWSRILIVTDHGFIHWTGVNERRLSPPLPDPAYSSRRALAYPASVTFEGPQMLASGAQWRVALPSGPSCFKTYGGLGYFHGGASLQEWIVPCLKIEWPAKAQPVQAFIQSLAQILSVRQKVVLEIQQENLFDNNDALTRDIELVARDDLQKQILFRSARTTLYPKQTESSVELIPEEGVEAERGTRVTLELRDARTHELLDTKPTVLMVELENW